MAAESHHSELVASGERLQSRIDRLAEISQPGRGVSRLAYSHDERAAHDLVSQWFAEAGCAVTTDPAGNTIAEREGTEQGLGALGAGSHLDSVYCGGAYDGIVGVVAGLEIAQLLHEAGAATRHPLRFVAFAGEEGARFGQACIGSKLAAGMTSLEDLEALTDRDGIALIKAMSYLGFDPERATTEPWRARDWSAFLELHIEQGSVLEKTGAEVGIVDMISGSTRLQFILSGVPSHTGGTPMQGRADALAAAAECVLIAEALASDVEHRGTRATVGKLDVDPNSITTIPGRVTFSLDVRDIDADRQRAAASFIAQQALEVCTRRGVRMELEVLADTSPVILPTLIREQTSDAARVRETSYRVLTSGASHDAQMINTIVPTGLIFIPSRNGGLSHVPDEFSTSEDIAVGTNVLLETLLNLDSNLSN
ncbi:allantoate deiminase [Brevibacterium sanguinis]|uniref:Allantoate deiminase n=2 Tax=Brevibacterium TaxID=1696 RepID=A0A366IF62_9MICO|nr:MULTISPECIES: Zn-dependent hydrolase [Brevibacterium]RBP61513.1 allantoate deiminase [Brevibacterium sanguinis]RBP68607.1 allantoate deiminase [Brevibacterium celere]